MITHLRLILPDVHATVEDIFAEGDKVAVRWTFRGTYQGEAIEALQQDVESLPVFPFPL